MKLKNNTKVDNNNDLSIFLKMCRELVDHSNCMQMATKYKKPFNYGFYCIKLQAVAKENLSEDEFNKLYPR